MDTDFAARRPPPRVVGYDRLKSLSRAFEKRYGVRPSIYREFGGRLSAEVAAEASADLPPILPRCLAGAAAVAPGAACGRCGGELEDGTAVRMFEDRAPICGACARERAPELATALGGGGAADAG